MLESHLRSRNATSSEARVEQSALESAIKRIEAETAEANKPSRTMDTGASTRTGALWALVESIRIIGRQPAILLIFIQAVFVESTTTFAGSSLSFYTGSSSQFYLATLWLLFVLLYTFAGIWGSLIDATDRALQPLRFWIYGFTYLARSVGALLWSIVLFLPAFVITTMIVFIGILYAENGFGAPSPRGPQVIQTLFELMLIVWLANFLWASRRLLIQLPGIFASGRTSLAARIIRERGWEVTALWLSLIALSFIFIAAEISLGLLSAISGMAGLFSSVLGSFGGAVPMAPFGIPQGGVFGAATPTISFAFPGGPSVAPAAPGNGFTTLSLALQLASWTLLSLFETFGCLASLVYYRSAGGSAEWFSLGATRPIRPVKPTPAAPPGRTAETHPDPALRTKETLTEKTGQKAAERVLRQAVLTVDWLRLSVPDFRPLLTGKLLPHVQSLLAAPERGVSAWPPDISPRAAGAIPVAAFTLLGLAAMIGSGGGLGACLVGGIFGFGFGIVALRVSAAFERRVIARKAAIDIGREASELDLSVASLALSISAVFTLLVTVLWRVSFVGLPLIGTVMMSGVSIGMIFSPAVTLFIARRLDVWPALCTAAAITASALFAWMLFTYLV